MIESKLKPILIDTKSSRKTEDVRINFFFKADFFYLHVFIEKCGEKDALKEFSKRKNCNK